MAKLIRIEFSKKYIFPADRIAKQLGINRR